MSLRRSFASEAIYSLLSLQGVKRSATSKRVIKKFKLSPKNQTTFYIKSILRVAWEEFACQIQGSHRHEQNRFLYKVSYIKKYLSFMFLFNHLNSLFKSNSLRREVGTLNLQVNSSHSLPKQLILWKTPREFFCNKE